LIEQRARDALGQGLTPKREQVWVSYEQISPDLVRTVIAGEDLRFFQHSGVDWATVKRAFLVNLAANQVLRGGSTITQQLAKNLFLSAERTAARKLHETVIAWEMEQLLGKRRILELYLNIIEWGEGVYGAEAAARHYFNTTAASLSLNQAVFLAAIIPSPRGAYNPALYPGRVQERSQKIIGLLPRVVVPSLTE
jgi:monofunctional biosynthetic peptidoglycan transglycosylase